MAQRKRKPKRRALDPSEVILGRVSVTIERLLKMVHEINPTHLDLPPDETARRYGLKTALQSKLLREHRDELRVVRDGDDLIAINHRYSSADACHARVSELDEDVRSWVRRLLDEDADERTEDEPDRADRVAVESNEESTEDLRDQTEEELYREGTKALGDWDYDRARACYFLAHRRSGGSPKSSRVLLELLVDSLAQDQDALDLTLSSEAVSDDAVRSLIAVAAARSGDLDRLERVVRGLVNERAAEACVIAAEAEVKAGGEAAARHWLEEAEHRGANTGDVARVADLLADLRASQRAPAEQEVQEAFDTGNTEEAKRLAVELQRHWPESAVARKILAVLEQKEKAVRIEDALRRAEQARKMGDHRRESELLREALLLGADVRQRLAELERAAKAKADDNEVARVLESLDSDLEAGLLAYVKLTEALRRRVSAQCRLPVLQWLDEIATSGGKDKAAVDAVLALGVAQEALGRGEVRSVDSLLASHERLLRGVTAAAEVRAEAAAQLERERVQKAQESLEEAQAAFERGDLERAHEYLGRADERLLDRDRLADLQQLRSELNRAREIQRLESAVAGTQEHSLRQRELVEQLIVLTDGEIRESWRHRLDELSSRIRKIWRVEVIEGEEAQKGDLRAAAPHRAVESVETWLLPGGGEMVLAVPLVDWLFIWVVSVDGQHVETAVRLRTPRPLGAMTTIVVDAPNLIVVGEKGDLLQISLDTWDVHEWRTLHDFFSKEETFEYVYPLPGTQYLWFCTSHRREKIYNHTRIVDRNSWRVHRDLGESLSVEPVGGEEQTVLVVTNRESGKLLGPNGVQLEREIPDGVPITSGAPEPTGQGVLLLSYDPALDAAGKEAPLHLVAVGANPTQPLVIEDTHYECGHSLASASELGLIFVAFDDAERLKISAIRRRGERFEQEYELSFPRETTLIVDKDRQRVVAASWTPTEGLSLRQLGAEAVALPQPGSHSTRLPQLGGTMFCQFRYQENSNRYPMMLDRLRAMKPGERRDRIESSRRSGELPQMFELVQAMRYLDEYDHLDEARRLHEMHPADPDVALLRAVTEAEAGHWSETLTTLESGGTNGLPESGQQHHQHLLGLARLHVGDLDGARAAWEEGLGLEGGCELDPLLGLVTAAEGADATPPQLLIAAIRAAEEHLDAGRLDEVFDALHVPWLYQLRELQGLARLAEAHLLREADSPQARFSKLVDMAAFCEAYGDRDNDYRDHLEVPGLSWPRARLDDIYERVREWIDRI